MNAELDQQMQDLVSNMKALTKDMNSSCLSPARLQWDSFLEHSTNISNQFRAIEKSVTPSLKQFVAYPTKHEYMNRTSGQCSSLKCIDIDPLQEEIEEDERYFRENLDELGLNDVPEEEYDGILTEQITNHNEFCKEGTQKFDSLINFHNLNEPESSIVKERDLLPQQYPSLSFMCTGTC